MANKIVLTQGDAVTLTITCSGHALTGATLTTYLPNADDSTLSLANAVHTLDADQVTNKGKFTVDISAAQSALLKVGAAQNIITKVEQSGNVIHFHGKGLLTVKDTSL